MLLPIDVACHQPLGRAAGEPSEETAGAIEHRVRDLSRWGRPIVLALHHPPLPHAWRAWQWVDGVDDAHDVPRVRLYTPSAGLALTLLEKRTAA